MHLPETASD